MSSAVDRATFERAQGWVGRDVALLDGKFGRVRGVSGKPLAGGSFLVSVVVTTPATGPTAGRVFDVTSANTRTLDVLDVEELGDGALVELGTA